MSLNRFSKTLVSGLRLRYLNDRPFDGAELRVVTRGRKWH